MSQFVWHLENVEDRYRILEWIGKVEFVDECFLSVEVQYMFPLLHHLLGIQPWTRDWESSNVNGSDQSTIQEYWIDERTIGHLNLIISEDKLLLLIKLNWLNVVSLEEFMHPAMYVWSSTRSCATAILVHLTWFNPSRLGPHSHQLWRQRRNHMRH